jgi:hypothetical protein
MIIIIIREEHLLIGMQSNRCSKESPKEILYIMDSIIWKKGPCTTPVSGT